jgi:hypothetical protein
LVIYARQHARDALESTYEAKRECDALFSMVRCRAIEFRRANCPNVWPRLPTGITVGVQEACGVDGMAITGMGCNLCKPPLQVDVSWSSATTTTLQFGFNIGMLVLAALVMN